MQPHNAREIVTRRRSADTVVERVISDPSTLKKLRLVADQAPLASLPISQQVLCKAITMGYARVVDVRTASWGQLITNFGEDGAREIRTLLAEWGLTGEITDD
ncbi:MAG: hypothetical protein E6R08_09080 [Nevskiaceae bacterium]|nr:MAG: hypothetical protein E6R08_09080 [Nevskiaceae bacterium]